MPEQVSFKYNDSLSSPSGTCLGENCSVAVAVASVQSGQFPSPLQPPLLSLRTAKAAAPPPPMDSHQGPGRGRPIASSMPIIGEVSIPNPRSQINQFSAANPFETFGPVENVPPASRHLPPSQQSIPSSFQHVAQQQQKSFATMQRPMQSSVSRFTGAPPAPRHAQTLTVTNSAPESSSVGLDLDLQQPQSHTTLRQHDYAALVANTPDITSFMDSFPGHLQGMKLIRDPPDLDTWRKILFHVDEMITLSEEQYVHLLWYTSFYE